MNKVYEQIYKNISMMGNPINAQDVSQYVGYEKAKLDIQQMIVHLQVVNVKKDENIGE